MNPVAPAARIPQSTTLSSSSPSKSPLSVSDLTESSLENTQPGVHISPSDPQYPRRMSSAFSSVSASSSVTDLSSASSQQTVRASQYPHMTNGTTSASQSSNRHITSPSPLASHTSQSRSRSRSPVKRSEDTTRGSMHNGNGTSVGSGSGRDSALSSQKTAFPRPPIAPSLDDPLHPSPDMATATTPLPPTSKDPTQGGLRRPGVVETLKLWLYQTLRIDSLDESDRRLMTGALLLFGVFVPLLAYVARLRGWRLRRGRRHLGSVSKVGSLEGSGSHIGIGGPMIADARQLSLAARAHGRPGTGSNVGVVRWLFESLKDSVVMAGKGLV